MFVEEREASHGRCGEGKGKCFGFEGRGGNASAMSASLLCRGWGRVPSALHRTEGFGRLRDGIEFQEKGFEPNIPCPKGLGGIAP